MNKKENNEKPKKDLKDKLKKKVEIPLFIIISVILLILFISLFSIRVPYKAKEKYKELEDYVIEIQEEKPDIDNPITERICEEKPAKTRIDNLQVYLKRYGLKEFKCYAEFIVLNENNIDGEFTYKFIFDINGKKQETEEKTLYIAKYSMVKFIFESDCLEEDKPKGEAILINSTKTIECKYETIYPNITITKNQTKQREIEKERIIEKTETLFEKITGKNKQEKIN